MRTLHPYVRFLIAAVWIFHGLYSKLLGGIPRHEMIVARILGEGIARPATIAIGIAEICLGLWALSGRWKIGCMIVQTGVIAAMNALEIYIAKDLLISGPGMVVLNAAFLGIGWWWALTADRPAPIRTP